MVFAQLFWINSVAEPILPRYIRKVAIQIVEMASVALDISNISSKLDGSNLSLDIVVRLQTSFITSKDLLVEAPSNFPFSVFLFFDVDFYMSSSKVCSIIIW